MNRSATPARTQIVRALVLVVVSAALAIAPATAQGGQFYSGTLSTIGPLGCKADWINQYGCAQSGFNYWFAVTLTKYNGERVALGMRGTNGTFYYFTYGAGERELIHLDEVRPRSAGLQPRLLRVLLGEFFGRRLHREPVSARGDRRGAVAV